MSSASSAVTYTSVYTDSKPGRVFWGADEELSDEGSLRVIGYGYDGLHMLPVAPPSPDYIPGPEEPQTPPAPQDEDEHEPMFIRPHDLDFMPEPIYPEYILLEDEHILSAEEQPLPPVVSPMAESPGYVAESDPKQDPEEYEDDETEDSPVDYPMDGGDDNDDDDSSWDDADDEDEDEEEEEHLAPADSAVVIPADELVSLPEETEPAAISFPPKAEVERLLAMPTPSPLTSLSPPYAGERLARCTAPAALPSPPLPPPLHMTAHVDRRMISPRLRCHLAREIVLEIAPITMGEVNTRVTELAELHKHDTQDLYALLEDAQDTHQETIQIVEDEAYAAREAWDHSIGLSQAVHSELQTHQEQTELAELRETDHRRQAHMAKTLRVIGDMRREMGDTKAELLALREQPRRAGQPGGDGRVPNHQDAPTDVKFATCTLLDAALTWWNSQIKSLGLRCIFDDLGSAQKEDDGQVLSSWRNQEAGNQVVEPKDETEKIDKYVSGLPDNIYESVKASKPKTSDETFELANDLMDQKLRTYAERQSNNKRKADESFRNNHGHQHQTLKRQNVARVYNMGTGERKPYSGNLPKCTKCHFYHTCTQKCHRCNKVGHFARDCKSSGNANVVNAQRNNGANPKGNGCFECGATWHFKRDCPKLKNKDGEKANAPGWVYAVGNAERRGNASRDPDSNVVTGTFLLNNCYASILFDTGADRSFISTSFSSLIDIVPTLLGNSYDVELADGKIVGVDTIMQGCTLNFLGHPFNIDLMPVEVGSSDVIIGMDWLKRCHAMIVYDEKLVQIPFGNETLTFRGDESNNGRESRLIGISCSKAQEYMEKGCQIFLA
nr:hypothetical protein [Tanacetum cinerariifolium]